MRNEISSIDLWNVVVEDHDDEIVDDEDLVVQDQEVDMVPIDLLVDINEDREEGMKEILHLKILKNVLVKFLIVKNLNLDLLHQQETSMDLHLEKIID